MTTRIFVETDQDGYVVGTLEMWWEPGVELYVPQGYKELPTHPRTVTTVVNTLPDDEYVLANPNLVKRKRYHADRGRWEIVYVDTTN